MNTQIWIAVSIYVLVAIARKRLGLEISLYQQDLLSSANQLILFD